MKQSDNIYIPTKEEFPLLLTYLFNRLRNDIKQYFYNDYNVSSLSAHPDDQYMYIRWVVSAWHTDKRIEKNSRIKHTTCMKIFKGILK